ncbi:MAG TPA: response regulator transcription factor [Aromatoleum sp.]|uniref:response regulator transcription factor n=1 Tax=Aromatoleum sp. TaxID=2307007 RepID=UPI002B46233E|nr:response regulator transcription factor [Aromatoleum sp.]HJV28667.1 response regulator transcription factor [Aromatoleum sp.]
MEEVEPIRVFLVSEFPIVACGLERIVEYRGPAMEWAGAVDGLTSALATLEGARADVVVVDVDGEQGLRAVEGVHAQGGPRILALTSSANFELHDAAVLAGACGVVRKTEPVAVLLKAIERIHLGEIWVDRMAAGRIFLELARKKKAELQPDPEAAKIALLTRKERLTVAEVSRDASASPRQIAERLHISEHTLRNHLTSIYAKLELGNRLELHSYAQRQGLAAK